MLWLKLVLVVVTLLNVHAVDAYIGGWSRAPLTLHPRPAAVRPEYVEIDKTDHGRVLTPPQSEPLQPEQQQIVEQPSDTAPALPERRVLMPRPLPPPQRIRNLPILRTATPDVDNAMGWKSEIDYSLDANRPLKPVILNPVEPSLPPRTLILPLPHSNSETEGSVPNLVSSTTENSILIVENENLDKIKEHTERDDLLLVTSRPTNEESLKISEESQVKVPIAPPMPLPARRLWFSRPPPRPISVNHQQILQTTSTPPPPEPEVSTTVLTTEPLPVLVERPKPELNELHESELVESNPQPLVTERQEPIIINVHEGDVGKTNQPGLSERERPVDVILTTPELTTPYPQPIEKQEPVIIDVPAPDIIEKHESEVLEPPRRLWLSRTLPESNVLRDQDKPRTTSPVLEEVKTEETEPQIVLIENKEPEDSNLHESKLIETNIQPLIPEEEKPIVMNVPQPTVINIREPEVVEKLQTEKNEPLVSNEEKQPVTIETQKPEVVEVHEIGTLVEEEQRPKVLVYQNRPVEWSEPLNWKNSEIVLKNKPLPMTNPLHKDEENPSSLITKRIIYRQRPDRYHNQGPVHWPLVPEKPERVPIPIPTTTTTPRTPLPTLPSYRPKTPLQPNDELQLMDYECRAANGYYSVQNDCDNYVECKHYMAYMNTCPDGLHFNRNAVWPEYPCSYPWEVECQAASLKHEPQPTKECPRQFGFFAVPDGDCSKYLMCQDGHANIMNCPPGLVFNTKESACDWPVNVPSCQPNVFQGFTCPALPEDEDPDMIYKYRHGNSCRDYVACQHGRPRLLSCDLGLAFDAESQVCVDADYVENCR